MIQCSKCIYCNRIRDFIDYVEVECRKFGRIKILKYCRSYQEKVLDDMITFRGVKND